MAYSTTIIFTTILSVIGSLYNPVTSQSTGSNARSFTCSHTQNASISYQNNINLMYSDFISHSSEEGFYNTSTGNGPDMVFGYYMCRGDLKPESCQNCIKNATQFAQGTNCEYQDGIFLSSKCIFRYANHSMYGLLDGFTSLTSSIGTNVSNYEQYNQTLMSTLEALANETAFGNNKGSIPGFATKEAIVTGDEKIYSVAQCTPDIVGVNCSKCLRDAISTLQSFNEGYKGAEISTPKCMLMYNNQSIYDVEVVEPTPSEVVQEPSSPQVEKPNEGDSKPPNVGVNANESNGSRPPSLMVFYTVLILFLYCIYFVLD